MSSTLTIARPSSLRSTPASSTYAPIASALSPPSSFTFTTNTSSTNYRSPSRSRAMLSPSSSSSSLSTLDSLIEEIPRTPSPEPTLSDLQERHLHTTICPGRTVLIFDAPHACWARGVALASHSSSPSPCSENDNGNGGDRCGMETSEDGEEGRMWHVQWMGSLGRRKMGGFAVERGNMLVDSEEAIGCLEREGWEVRRELPMTRP